jgi:hypothetical protein
MTFEYRSFFLSLALTLFVVAPIAAERWVEFKDPSGNFSVEFQSAPGVEPKKGFRSADAPNETRTGSSIDGDATQKIPRWRRLAGFSTYRHQQSRPGLWEPIPYCRVLRLAQGGPSWRGRAIDAVV